VNRDSQNLSATGIYRKSEKSLGKPRDVAPAPAVDDPAVLLWASIATRVRNCTQGSSRNQGHNRKIDQEPVK
jgi:hypothetical protein